jgi:NADH-quinone oxidoreductase subunit C
LHFELIMTAPEIIDILTPLLPGASFEVGRSIDFATIYVRGEHLVETCRTLRDNPALRFTTIIEVTAADYFPRQPRFEVVYHLLSIEHRMRLRVKVRVSNTGSLPTVEGVWKGAGWPEREVWDMFGIVFEGHADLRRLLMPEDWDGHPARKDYPVQISKPTQTYEPMEISEAEFRANIERDRVRRPH